MFLGSIAVIAMLFAAAMPARADVVASLAGTWRGEIAAVSGDGPSEPVRFELSGTAEGFDLAFSVAGQDVARMTFEPADTPGVFVQEGRKGLLSMFKDDVSVNPLTGVPLVWSRIDGETLFVYRLHIGSSGAYLLDRIALEPGDEGTTVERTRLRHGEPAGHAAGRLAREAGR